MKSKIKEFLIIGFICVCADLFWIFNGYWWHHFFLVGYAAIGWYVAAYFRMKSRIEMYEN